MVIVQMGGAPRGGEVARKILVVSHAFIVIFFVLELVYRSESTRESTFFAAKGWDPMSARAFLWFLRYEFITLGARAQKGSNCPRDRKIPS